MPLPSHGPETVLSALMISVFPLKLICFPTTASRKAISVLIGTEVVAVSVAVVPAQAQSATSPRAIIGLVIDMSNFLSKSAKTLSRKSNL
jgi:hypothetical protein